MTPLVVARCGLVLLPLWAVGCGGRTALGDADGSRGPAGCLAAADEFLAISSGGDLYALRVPSLERRLVSRRVCGRTEVNTMAVSREGGVVLGLVDGSFQAMDAELECSESFPVLNDRLAAFDLVSYGMNFVGDGGDGETLFLSLNYFDNPTVPSNHLATFDAASHEVRPGAEIAAPEWAIEIAGTADGRLYGYQLGGEPGQSLVVEIDTASGALIDEIPTGSALGLGSLAVAVTDDAVYAFGARMAEASSHVVRVDRATQRVVKLGSVPFVVVGAGASSCAARAAVP
jgi:hypothetical protein